MSTAEVLIVSVSAICALLFVGEVLFLVGSILRIQRGNENLEDKRCWWWGCDRPMMRGTDASVGHHFCDRHGGKR